MFPFLWQASEALAAAGKPAAVRRALKFEKELADLSREGLQTQSRSTSSCDIDVISIQVILSIPYALLVFPSPLPSGLCLFLV